MGELTDLEVTRLCAEASEVWKEAHKWFPTWTLDATFSGIREANGQIYLVPNNPMRQDPQLYDPLHDDAQAFQLVKKCRLDISAGHGDFADLWCVRHFTTNAASDGNDLLRCICLCVARMQLAKEKANV